MAKQSPPAAIEPAQEPAATEVASSQPAPTVEELQKLLDEKEAGLKELAAKLATAREAFVVVSNTLAEAREEHDLCKSELDLKIEELAARDATIEGLKASLDNIRREHERFVVRVPSVDVAIDTRRCVALARMRTIEGWLSAGDTFDATEADLEGYELGVHFDLRD